MSSSRRRCIIIIRLRRAPSAPAAARQTRSLSSSSGYAAPRTTTPPCGRRRATSTTSRITLTGGPIKSAVQTWLRTLQVAATLRGGRGLQCTSWRKKLPTYLVTEAPITTAFTPRRALEGACFAAATSPQLHHASAPRQTDARPMIQTTGTLMELEYASV
jgi:hypothetical protein